MPTAPAPGERYLYLGPQARVYPLVQGAMSIAVGLAVVVFFGSHPQTAVFVAPAVLTLFAGALSTWSISARRRVELDEHRERVARWRPAEVPGVDVFLPTAGEPLSLLRNTYEHVVRLRLARTGSPSSSSTTAAGPRSSGSPPSTASPT